MDDFTHMDFPFFYEDEWEWVDAESEELSELLAELDDYAEEYDWDSTDYEPPERF